jgi:hypothetical protein
MITSTFFACSNEIAALVRSLLAFSLPLSQKGEVLK